jgi:3-oxoacyl-[acyl-carrier protein] reductase
MSAAQLRRTALVTGGARGIGAAISERLLRQGLNVVVVDVLAAAVSTAADGQERRLSIVGDVSSQEDWERFAGVTAERFGSVDILVNNAAISLKLDGRRPTLLETQPNEWQRVLDVNLTGAFLGIRAVAPGMIDAGWGRIVNMSSQAAFTGARVSGVHYGVSKAGLIGLTRTLAAELGPAGITVNAVAPGRIESPMASPADADVASRMISMIPSRRFGTPDDIAEAVTYLVSDEAGYVNGATLEVNGGSHMG